MSRDDKLLERNRPVYNLKAVVKETGIKPPTLRAWERRYGFPNPSRTEGGHRQYSQSDIEALQWLSARQDDGVSISHAIDLWRSRAEAAEGSAAANGLSAAAEPAPLPPLPSGEHVQLDELGQEWMAACLAFDGRAAEGVLARAFALFPPEVVCVQLLQNGLAEIGQAWHRGEATLQQEHFASALSVQRLEILIASAAPPWRLETIIIATAEGDFHTFGALLFTFLLRRQGWRIIYLGASVPAQQLEATIERLQPQLVILTSQLLRTAAALKEVAELLQRLGVKLAFGGAAFSWMEEPQRYIPGHFLGHSLEGGVQLIRSLLDQPADTALPTIPVRSLSEALKAYNENRAFVEVTVRAAFVTSGKPMNQLASINRDFGEAIAAALTLGDIKLLGSDMDRIGALLAAFGWPGALLREYLVDYHQAARIHLGDSAKIIVAWLSGILSD